MEDKEQIKIHGVDVCKCQHYNKNIKMDCLLYPLQPDSCSKNPNCYYKQLQRKTTECNKYEQALIEVYKIIVALLTTKDVKYLSKEINEIIDIINKAKEGNNE